MTGITLQLRVIPNASRDEVVGMVGDVLRLRCRAPALEGRANEAVIAILARQLGVRDSQVRLIRGARSRTKTVRIDGLDSAAVLSRLNATPPGSRG